MSNIIELARYRGSAQRDQQQPKPPDGTILIQWQPDGTHAYTLTGQYARSVSLTTRALAQLIEEINYG